ncbi:MAG: T9SS type A sorting domain-containing protein [Bacteroidota bacterium]
MKLVIFLICIYIFTSDAAHSQTFSVQANPDSAQLGAGNTFKSTISILPEDGYNATVFLSASSMTLKSIQLSHSQLNLPYSPEPVITVQTAISDTGIHHIIIEGKNGQFSVKDTIKVLLTAQTQFKTYKTIYPVFNLGITSQNVVYGLGFSKQYFFGKIADEVFTFSPAWDNFTEDNRPGSLRLLEVDKNDNLWAAQGNGIGKFDGKFWTLNSLDNNSTNFYLLIRRLIVDSSNRVWYHADPDAPGGVQFSSFLGMIENGKVVRMDSSIKVFLTGETKPWYTKIDQIASDSDGSVWVMATVSWSDFSKTYELLRYRQNSWENVDYPGKDTAIHTNGTQNYNYFSVNPKGGIIMTTYNYLYQPLTQYELINNQWANSKFSEEKITYFSFDYAGRAFYFKGNTFKRWEDSAWVAHELPFSISAIGGMYDLKVDRNNNIWIPTGSSSSTGIIVYNPDGVTQPIMVGITQYDNLHESFESISVPNPAQNSITIHYSLKVESPVSICIYNSLGIEVFKNNLGFKNAGENREILSMSELPSGQYYYVLKARAQQSTHPLVIVR